MANRWAPWIEATIVKPALQDIAAGAGAKIAGLDLALTTKLATRVVGMWCLDVENIGAVPGQFVVDQYLTGVLHRVGPAPAAIPAGGRIEITTIGSYDFAAGATGTLEIFGASTAAGFRIHATRSMVTFFGMPSQGISY